jgi:hypothetical protein
MLQAEQVGGKQEMLIQQGVPETCNPILFPEQQLYLLMQFPKTY